MNEEETNIQKLVAVCKKEERERVLKILREMIAEHEDPWSDSEAHKRALLYDAITRIESGEP